MNLPTAHHSDNDVQIVCVHCRFSRRPCRAIRGHDIGGFFRFSDGSSFIRCECVLTHHVDRCAGVHNELSIFHGDNLTEMRQGESTNFAFTYRTNLVMLQWRIMKFSMRRRNFVCSIVTQFWCKTFILIGLNATLRRRKLRWTCNSLEFTRAGEDFCWNHDKSTPYRSETSGIAESAVNTVKKGTSAPGSVRWWGEARECFCYCESHKTSLQTESHRAKEHLELHFGS